MLSALEGRFLSLEHQGSPQTLVLSCEKQNVCAPVASADPLLYVFCVTLHSTVTQRGLTVCRVDAQIRTRLALGPSRG